jgi:hypothetical protein
MWLVVIARALLPSDAPCFGIVFATLRSVGFWYAELQRESDLRKAWKMVHNETWGLNPLRESRLAVSRR